MKKFIILLAIIVLGGLIFWTKPLLAAIRCETQYGGGEVCVRTGELQIDKEVWNIGNGLFVDNMGINDYKFSPGEEITFRLKIKNVGDKTFDKVYVKDTLPDYLELISGDLSFEINDLSVGETEEREFKVRVVSADKFPDKSTICVVNSAETWSEDEKDKDTSQVCLEKKVLGVKVLPPTGPKNSILILGFSIISAVLSLILLRKAKEGSWKI